MSSAALGWNGRFDLNVGSVQLNRDELVWAFTTGFYDTVAIGLGDAPGVTAVSGNPTHSTAGVYYNNSWKWFTDGTLNAAARPAELRTVLLHEYGHAHGLDHPAGCGPMTTAEQSSVMNVDFTQKWYINSDDIAGMNSSGMY